MKKLITGIAVILALSGAAVSAAPAPKVDVCHFDEVEGVYVLINVSGNGWTNGHSKHAEDFLFDAALFNDDCSVIVVEEPEA